MTPTRLLLLAAALGCGRSADTDAARTVNPTPSSRPGDGVFAEGCPVSGQSLARVIEVDATLPGEVAVGTRGDLLLANEHAAFVITDAVGQSTFWYYGGAVADAVPMIGCDAGDDKLDDLGVVLAELDLLEVEQSIVRAFRADAVEVLADGSDGGPAIVRATGTDDVHWLVEHTLINDASSGKGRPFSEPFGTAVTVDYILRPESPVLELVITVENRGDAKVQLFEAELISYGDGMSQYTYSSAPLELGGFRFDAGIPWVTATDGELSYLLSAPGAALAGMSIAGVNIFTDTTQLTNPAFGLEPGDQTTFTRYFAVTPGGGGSGLAATLEANPDPVAGDTPSAGVVTGRVVDASGAGVASGVRIEARAPEAIWGTFDELATDSSGAFELAVPDFELDWEWRLVATDPGRDESEPVEVKPGDVVQLEVPPVGAVTVTLVDGDGGPSPARLHLVRTDGAVRDEWIARDGDRAVPPGTWDYTLTRGYEFVPVRGQLVVPDDGRATLAATLVRGIDTTGWVSADTHVHSSDSPDGSIPIGDQLDHAAAHGLEIVIRTEHEHIVDRTTLPADLGLDGWLGTVGGEEVTSVAVEHMTMFPVEPDGTGRGGFVEWYGLDIAELFAAMRIRSGGGVNLLNHPSYLDRIGWDRVAAAPTLDDPTLLGAAPDADLWSWNLDGIEVLNGHSNPFIDGNRRFDNWMSMVNAGHPVVGVGCSDDHHGWEVGFPRTYVASSTDDPDSVLPDDLAAAFLDGRVMASAGAFARVDIEGSGPGELHTDRDGEALLSVHLEALPEVDVTHFVVFVNCDQVASVRATDPGGVVKFSGTVPVSLPGDSHVVVAAFGTTYMAAGLPQYDATRMPRVLTSPIYVDGDGDGEFSAPGGRECSYDLSFDAAE